MSLYFILLLASVGGAVVFFFSGLLLGRGRGNRAAVEQGASAPAEQNIDATAEQLAAALAEAEHLRGEIIRTRAESDRVDREMQALRGELQATGAEVQSGKQALETARKEVAAAASINRALESEKARLESDRKRLESEHSRLQAGRDSDRRELERLRASETELRAAVQRAEEASGDLRARTLKIRELETALEALRLERTSWQDREHELTRQLSGIDPEVEKTLRHDLVVARELLRTQEEKGKRLDEINNELRRERDALASRAARLDALERENQELRVRALATDLRPAATRPPATINVAAGAESSKTTDKMIGTHALQLMVGRMAKLESVRAAVIGDDLGLVVACQGTHGDELAALGALFDRACGEARKVLPLDHIQRVIIEDEGNISVTVRPLRSYDVGAGDDKLTLVTLAYGAEPDPGQVASILGQDAAPKGGDGNGQPSALARETAAARQLGT